MAQRTVDISSEGPCAVTVPGSREYSGTCARETLHAQFVAIGRDDCVLLHGVPSCFDDLSSSPHMVQSLPLAEAVCAAQLTILIGPVGPRAAVTLLQQAPLLGAGFQYSAASVI